MGERGGQVLRVAAEERGGLVETGVPRPFQLRSQCGHGVEGGAKPE